MSEIVIKFPSEDRAAATAFGRALLEIGGERKDDPVPWSDDSADPVADLEGHQHDGLDIEQITQAEVAAGNIEPEKPIAETATTAACSTETSVPATALSATTAACSTETSVPATALSATKVDMKGVPFDADMCGNSADAPFYGSGKKSGQWKKKRNLDEGVYDEWYAAALADVPSAGEAETVDTAEAFAGHAHQTDASLNQPVNTAGAFATAAAQGAEAPAPAGNAPKTAGELVKWIASETTAGNVTQEIVGLAWDVLALKVTDLFPPAVDAEEAARRCAAVYAKILELNA